jgi:hypothetical protein
MQSKKKAPKKAVNRDDQELNSKKFCFEVVFKFYQKK